MIIIEDEMLDLYKREEIDFVFGKMLDEEVILTVPYKKFFKTREHKIFAYIKFVDTGYCFVTKAGKIFAWYEFSELAFTNIEKMKQVHKLLAIKRTFKK